MARGHPCPGGFDILFQIWYNKTNIILIYLTRKEVQMKKQLFIMSWVTGSWFGERKNPGLTKQVFFVKI
jgi:hypothetical protein